MSLSVFIRLLYLYSSFSSASRGVPRKLIYHKLNSDIFEFSELQTCLCLCYFVHLGIINVRVYAIYSTIVSSLFILVKICPSF